MKVVMMKMMEAIAQESTEDIHLVDFALACIRGLRNLKESQVRGELDTVTYQYLAHDIENMIDEVTQTLLLGAHFDVGKYSSLPSSF